MHVSVLKWNGMWARGTRWDPEGTCQSNTLALERQSKWRSFTPQGSVKIWQSHQKRCLRRRRPPRGGTWSSMQPSRSSTGWEPGRAWAMLASSSPIIQTLPHLLWSSGLQKIFDKNRKYFLSFLPTVSYSFCNSAVRLSLDEGSWFVSMTPVVMVVGLGRILGSSARNALLFWWASPWYSSSL